MPPPIRQDAQVASRWRAAPGSFLALMALYESNHLRLRWLAGDLRSLQGVRRSSAAGDCDLVMTVLELSPYTTTLELTYDFSSANDAVANAPDMRLRLYHDAGVAEALGWGEGHEHRMLRELRQHAERELDHRWARNIMLNKWLEYCLDRGHSFR